MRSPLFDSQRSAGRANTLVFALLVLLGTSIDASTSAPKEHQKKQDVEHARVLDLANNAVAEAEKLLPEPGPVHIFYPESRKEEKRKAKEMRDVVERLRNADAALSGFLKTHPDDKLLLSAQVDLDFIKRKLPIAEAGKAANRPDFLPSRSRDPMKTLDHILELDPNDPVAYGRKAELYANPNLRGLNIAPDYAAAIDSTRKAIDHSVYDVYYRETLANLLLETGRDKEAMDALRPIYSGHHPAYLLLVDWSNLPLPAGAVLKKQATETAVQTLAVTGKDNPGLRERWYDVAQSASDLESFYRGYWKDFHFVPEGAEEIENGQHVRNFRASFLWQNGEWVSVGSAMSQQALETGLTIFVSEYRKDPKSGDGSPALRCSLSISNDRLIPTKNEIPSSAKAILENADRLELLSLESHYRSEKSGAHFYGYPVHRTVVVTSPGTRKALVSAFERAVQENQDVIAVCFNPRHGLRASNGDKHEDFVICFECLHVEAHGDVEGEFLISESAATVFDTVLRHSRQQIPSR